MGYKRFKCMAPSPGKGVAQIGEIDSWPRVCCLLPLMLLQQPWQVQQLRHVHHHHLQGASCHRLCQPTHTDLASSAASINVKCFTIAFSSSENLNAPR